MPEDITLEHTTNGSASDPAALGIEGHILQIRDMADAIRSGRKPMVDAYEGRKPIEVIAAVYESAKTGKPVELANFRYR